MDLKKFQEEHGALLVWALALMAVTFLVYTNKIPASTIEYLLAWAAGQAYSRRQEKKAEEKKEESDVP
jgi:hypothetical protein